MACNTRQNYPCRVPFRLFLATGELSPSIEYAIWQPEFSSISLWLLDGAPIAKALSMQQHFALFMLVD